MTLSEVCAADEIDCVSQETRFHVDLEPDSNTVLLHGIDLSIGRAELLFDAMLELRQGVRYGLVGRNGSGKSTLLRAMATGKVVGFPRGISVGYIQVCGPSILFAVPIAMLSLAAFPTAHATVAPTLLPASSSHSKKLWETRDPCCKPYWTPIR